LRLRIGLDLSNADEEGGVGCHLSSSKELRRTFVVVPWSLLRCQRVDCRSGDVGPGGGGLVNRSSHLAGLNTEAPCGTSFRRLSAISSKRASRSYAGRTLWWRLLPTRTRGFLPLHEGDSVRKFATVCGKPAASLSDTAKAIATFGSP
jgi:hypothetical protein